MNTPRICSLSLAAAVGWTCLVVPKPVSADWRESFDSLDPGHSILKSEGWNGFQGFPGGNPPTAAVVDGKGANNSRALAISHDSDFRADNFGLIFDLPESYDSGVVWVQAKLKQPATWNASFFLDAYGPERGQILARAAGGPHEDTRTKTKSVRWHCTWVMPFWRHYSHSKLQTENWQTVTMRLDLDAKSYAAWIDDMPLGEEMSFAAKSPFARLRLSVCGNAESPALLDDLYVGRQTPEGMQAPDLLPKPEDDLVFRFAAIGDPQLGFAGYKTDMERFRMAVNQVNRSGAELSLILGDMVHVNKNEQAYQDLAALAKGLDAPHYYIRGNHEEMDLFKKYFNEESNYAFVHKGIRFVVLDAIGNHAGLTEDQLTFVENEFSAATKAGEDIILAVHVSPWQNNSRGRGKYNQIGEGRDRLRELMKEHQVILSLSGHLHTGLWGAKEEETQYFVLPGTALAKTGPVSWCVMDVYPDRIVMHQKPLFFAYEKEGVEKLHGGNGWLSYKEWVERFPHTIHGPMSIPRRGQVKKEAASVEKEKIQRPPVDRRAASGKIDALIAQNQEKHGVKPYEPISDDVFLRRAYLNIAGRVPTPAESRSFHDSATRDKREKLIVSLLNSEGYVANFYNYWADLLRINGGLDKGRPAAEDAYQLWIKKALRENLPYDEMVHQLITAADPWWEDGAVGYFIRDRGMPLDAMSNTVRTFLGTRIECAQCHDHPFDKWTQMDFYKMAAFTYGVDSGLNPEVRKNHIHFFSWTREKQAEEYNAATGDQGFPVLKNEAHLESYMKSPNYPKALKRLNMSEDEFRKTVQKGFKAFQAGTERYWRLRPVLDSVYRPVLYTAATEKRGKLKLPHDYQYNDAKPHDVIEPDTMFGLEAPHGDDDSRIGAFADWLTSEENPAFSRIIVNRLWKEAFGYGIFEPIDEWTDSTPVSNPELLSYLQQLMIDLDYDMKAFLQVVFSTQSWQREVHVEPVIPGTPYHFPGPILRRMSAEQVWDSVVGLTIAEPEKVRPRLAGQLGRLEFQRSVLEHLESHSPDEFVAMLDRLATAYEENTAQREAYREQRLAARNAGNQELYDQLGKDDYRARRMRGHILWDIGFGYEGYIEAEKARETPTKAQQSVKVEIPPDVALLERPVPPRPAQERGQSAAAYKAEVRAPHAQYVALTREMARASELSSPSPRGHFLRDFGQSDRAEIENAAVGASIPQALNLLNGPLFEGLTNRFSILGGEVYAADGNAEKIRLIFQGMLTRQPTPTETRIAAEEFERFGPQASDSLIWALLNSRQFLFIR